MSNLLHCDRAELAEDKNLFENNSKTTAISLSEDWVELTILPRMPRSRLRWGGRFSFFSGFSLNYEPGNADM